MMRRRPSPVSEARTFERHRPLLFSIAYRMLGSAMDAEDVVQEAYQRWQGREGEVRFPKAYLCMAVTRFLVTGSARARREQYVGPWLHSTAQTRSALAKNRGHSSPVPASPWIRTEPTRGVICVEQLPGHGRTLTERMKGRNKDDQ